MKNKKVFSFLLMQIILVISVNAQTVSEYVKTNHITYRCAYCKSIKKEYILDIESIKNTEIAKNATTYAMASAMLSSAGSSGYDICDISRTGNHRYEQISKTVTKELYTANKVANKGFNNDATEKASRRSSNYAGTKKIFIRSAHGNYFLNHGISDRSISLADQAYNPSTGAYDGELWEIVNR